MNSAIEPPPDTIAEYDALADLFLTDDAPALVPTTRTPSATTAPASAAPASTNATSPTPASTKAVQIDGLIVGHLPVLASAWVTQYARHEAQQSGEPVALLRLHADQVILDAVFPSGQRPPADLTTSDDGLRAAIERLGARCARWLVRVDRTAEPGLLDIQGLSSLALLTGVDDAAVVASYQLIKSMESSEGDEKPLRLVIMGASDSRAANAQTTLRAAASKFLGREIESAATVGKIGGAASLQLFRGHAPEDLEDLLALIAATKPTLQPQPRPAAPAIAPAPAATEPSAAAPIAAPRVVPTTTAPAPLPSRPKLAQHIRGLTPLPIDCPYAKLVELAADAHGRLHLLAGSVDNAPPGEAAQQLLTAAAWANDHAPLLAAACPTLKSAADPTLHILTTHPPSARHLLDTGLRVHAATKVELAGATAWAITDLN